MQSGKRIPPNWPVIVVVAGVVAWFGWSLWQRYQVGGWIELTGLRIRE